MKRTEGFTVVELLIAAAVGILLLGMVVFTTISSRRVMNLDTARLSVNENLRSAFLVINNDIRQTGEQLNSTFPAFSITSGTTDSITIRRAAVGTVLPVCKSVNGGATSQIAIAIDGSPGSYPDGCAAPVATTGTSIDPNLGAWRSYRLAQPGQAARAFIYDPKNQRGEFFTYTGEDGSGKYLNITSNNFTYNYNKNDSPLLFLLEDHTYYVDAGKLWMRENAGAPAPVAPSISDLQATATVKVVSGGATTYSTLTGDFPQGGYDWKDLASVQVDLTGSGSAPTASIKRTLSEKTTLRNAFSADQ